MKERGMVTSEARKRRAEVKPRGMVTSDARKRREELTEGKVLILKFRCAEPVSLVPEVPTNEAVINNQRFF